MIGEYQLEALLEQIMTQQQYAKNVRTKEGSRDSVEFAVKIPEKATAEGYIWLPIDAKFPPRITNGCFRPMIPATGPYRGVDEKSVRKDRTLRQGYSREVC